MTMSEFESEIELDHSQGERALVRRDVDHIEAWATEQNDLAEDMIIRSIVVEHRYTGQRIELEYDDECFEVEVESVEPYGFQVTEDPNGVA